MKTIEELQSRIAEIDARQKELLGTKDHVMTSEEVEEFDNLDAERDQCVKEIADIRKAESESAARRQKLEQRKPPTSGRRTTPTGPSVREDVHIEVKEPEKFTSLGEQLQAIATVQLTGQSDNRLIWESLTPHAAVTGSGAGVPSDGGYLIQQDFQTELASKMYNESGLLSRVRRIPIGANSDGLKINMIDEQSRAVGSRWGGVQTYWGAEADSATAKKPKFRQASLELKDLIGLAYITERLLQDATALEAVFGQAFNEEMTFAVEDAIVNGTGAGQPMGFLNAPCLVSVSKETGQSAATIQYENVLKMWSRMWARSRGNAVWLINQDVEPQLNAMAIPVGTGGMPVYLPPGGLSQSPYGTLMGRPVIPTEYNPTLGTVGDITLVDLSQYVVIEKGGMKADSSIHVRFINNERTFRFIYRVDGQPTWNTALTPAKGTNTLSPFVALATRS